MHFALVPALGVFTAPTFAGMSGPGPVEAPCDSGISCPSNVLPRPSKRPAQDHERLGPNVGGLNN